MGIYKFKKDDAYDFARTIGEKTKERNGQLHLHHCPYCKGGVSGRKDTYTFGIDLETGMFKCLRASCGVTGNMVTLSRDFEFSLGNEVDEYYRPKKKYRTFKTPKEAIRPTIESLSYLEKRGISNETAEKYEITTAQNKPNVLVFPFYDDKGILRTIKYRKTDYDKNNDVCKEWTEKNTRPILFGMKQCSDKFDRLIICEGQIDSLSVSEAGIENAVSVPFGKNGMSWIPFCYNWVSKFDEIIVFGDCERDEITLLEDISKRFPCKIKHVRQADYLGCKDANEILITHGREAVRNAVENAIMIPIKRVRSLSEVEDVNIYQIEKLRTGISSLDKFLYGGIPFGMVTIVTGIRGCGKSTWSSQMMAEAIEQGYVTFAYSGELPNYMYKGWFDYQVAGRQHIIENNTMYGINRFITNLNKELIHSWYEDKAFIYDSQIVDGEEQEDLLKTIEESIQQYGVKVVLLDNLMTAMYLDAEKGYDKYDKQGTFVRKLTSIALTYNVCVILVAHRRKNNFSQDINDEISGSGDISNLAGIVLGYDRPSDKDIESGTATEGQRYVSVSKNRLFGKVKNKGWLTSFDETSKRVYMDQNELLYKYGWESDSTYGFNQVEMEDETPFD